MRLLVLTSALKFREKQICGAFLTFHTKIYLALLFLPCISGSSSKHLISMKTALVQMFYLTILVTFIPRRVSIVTMCLQTCLEKRNKKSKTIFYRTRLNRMTFWLVRAEGGGT